MTRLEQLCEWNNQQGGTIHQFNEQYGCDVMKLNDVAFDALSFHEKTKGNETVFSGSLQTDTLDRIIRMLKNAVSDDVTRHQLCHVKSKPLNDNRVELTACDGHMLAQVIVTDEALFNAGLGYIHRENLPFLTTIKKQCKYVIPTESSKGSLKIDGKEFFTQEKVNYPNVEQIKPKFDGKFEIGLNAELLLSLAESLKEGKTPIVHLVINDNIGPIKVFVGDNEGVLMPVRITKKIKEIAPKGEDKNSP